MWLVQVLVARKQMSSLFLHKKTVFWEKCYWIYSCKLILKSGVIFHEYNTFFAWSTGGEKNTEWYVICKQAGPPWTKSKLSSLSLVTFICNCPTSSTQNNPSSWKSSHLKHCKTHRKIAMNFHAHFIHTHITHICKLHIHSIYWTYYWKVNC